MLSRHDRVLQDDDDAAVDRFNGRQDGAACPLERDENAVGDSLSISDDRIEEAHTVTAEAAASNQVVGKRHLRRIVFIICTWYGLSNAIILSTKWLFQNYFPFPLMVTTYYNSLSALLAMLLCCHPKLRPQESLSRAQFTSYVLPIGVMTAVEIGCSNSALKLLTVSFGTILKGMAPIFTFSWGLVFGLETFSWKICACLFTMAAGIVLASLGEGHEFEVWGFLLQLFSTCLGGLRWATTHKLLLEGQPGSHHMSPLKAILYTSPTTSLCVLPVALAMEGAKVWKHELQDGLQEGLTVLTTLTISGSLVFCLIMSEYWLVGVTSSLALSVAGVFKELLTIFFGILMFAEKVDFLNVLGFVVSQFGILVYVFLRYDRGVAYTQVDANTGQQEQQEQQEQSPDQNNDEAEECFVDEAENLEMPKVRHRVK